MSQMPSSTPGGSSARRNPTPAEIVTMAGGGVAFIFSFLPFYTSSTVSFGGARLGGGSTSAWGSGLFSPAFPIATFIALFALAAGVLAALDVFGVSLPERMLSFTKTQLILVFGFFATLLAAGFLIQSNTQSLGFGYYLMLLGSVATLVGGVMLFMADDSA